MPPCSSGHLCIIYNTEYNEQGFLVAQWERTPLPGLEMCKTQDRTQGREDPLEKEIARSSILAWEIPGTQEPGRLQSMVLQSVRHGLVTKPRQQQQHNVHVCDWL